MKYLIIPLLAVLVAGCADMELSKENPSCPLACGVIYESDDSVKECIQEFCLPSQ